LPRLENKVVLLSGGASGIGAETARLVVREGGKAVLADRDEAKGRALAAELGKAATFVPLDVTDEPAIARIAQEVGDVDVLFNCAGIVHNGSILEASPRDWDQAMSVNVRSMFLVTRAFLPGMLKKQRGSIINMASVASSVRGLPNRCVYGASKAAVIGLTKSIAADYVRQGVRCNAIAPGTIDTPSLQGRINAQPDPAQARKDFIARQPMGRLGTVEDMAGIMLYLASDESLFATGQIFSIDGGMTI